MPFLGGKNTLSSCVKCWCRKVLNQGKQQGKEEVSYVFSRVTRRRKIYCVSLSLVSVGGKNTLFFFV